MSESSPLRICLRCGNTLPTMSGLARKYCDECAAERNRELTRERRQKAARRMQEVRQQSKSMEDRKYCRKCIYYGSEEYGHNLCDYMLRTGLRRGCHYGTGCERRVIKVKGVSDGLEA